MFYNSFFKLGSLVILQSRYRSLLCCIYILIPVVACKEISLEGNAKKSKYMVMSQEQYARQNYNLKIGNKSFERMG